MKDPAVITDDRAKELCKLGQGSACCSFLGMGPGGRWNCMKGSDLTEVIVKKREAGDIRVMGDNCSGPPEFTPLPT